MRTDLPHLASRLFGTPLLVDARKLDAIVPAFLRRLNGEGDDSAAAGDYREPGDPTIASGIAVIPIIGTLVRRKTALDAYSGLTSYGDVSKALRRALDDARVRAILLQVDSFGGEASGCFELCDEMFAARGRKPIWAVADVMALSGGYAVLSQASRCFVAPSGSVGSIGAVFVHCERSQMNEAMGITYTVIRAGLRKADLNGFEPLPKIAAEKAQESLDKLRDTFVKTTARARPGLTERAARATEAQWYDADDALRLKLVDAIGTYEAVFAELAQTVAPAAAVQAPPQPPAPIEEPEEEDEVALAEAAALHGEEEMTDQIPAAPPIQPAAPTAPAAPAATGIAPAPAATAAPTGGGGEVVSLDQARQQGREAYAAEVREITQLCTIARQPALAAEFIDKSMNVDAVRAALVDRAAAADAAVGEIANAQPGRAVNYGNLGQVDNAKVDSWGKAFDRANGKVA